MSNRVDRYCLSCGNVTVVDAGYYAGSSFYQCETCGSRGMSNIFPQATVFHRITASPEVLADKLVYRKYYILRGETWASNVLTAEFETKTEAIAATVAKLKEMAE